MFKKLGLVLVVILLIAGGAIFYLKNNLDSIVKDAMEYYGSQVTKTKVKVDTVRITLTTGEGVVEGISVGNPESYVAARAVNVGNVTLKVDTKSIASSGPVIINEVNIDKPYINYEVGAKGGSNLQDIQKNASSYGGAKAKADKAKMEQENPGSGRKVIIRDLYVRNGQISVTHALLKGKEITTNLPLIHLRNIGKPGEGSTGAEIGKQIMTQISDEATKAGSAALVKELPDFKSKAKEAIKSFFGN